MLQLFFEHSRINGYQTNLKQGYKVSGVRIHILQHFYVKNLTLKRKTGELHDYQTNLKHGYKVSSVVILVLQHCFVKNLTLRYKRAVTLNFLVFEPSNVILSR